MKTFCCPTCGQPVPRPSDDLSVTLPIIQKRIFTLVERHGQISAEVLYTAIYGSDPNGGPGREGLRVNVYHLNKKLVPHGFAVRAQNRTRNRGGGRFYRFVAEAAE
jgi:hypothetical protein